MLNTLEITTATKSSIKLQSGTTANRHLCGGEESNSEQREALVNYDASIEAAAIGEKAHLGTKWLWTVNKSSP